MKDDICERFSSIVFAQCPFEDHQLTKRRQTFMHFCCILFWYSCLESVCSILYLKYAMSNVCLLFAQWQIEYLHVYIEMSYAPAIIIVLLVVALFSEEIDAKTTPRKFTKGNSKSFVPKTRGDSLGIQRSKIVTNEQYRNAVKIKYPECDGPYCLNGEWRCPQNSKGSRGSTDCYNVEHIIDKNGPEFKDYSKCKDAIGNKIMAHGEWNQALGRLAEEDYQTVIYEKTRVYSQETMDEARASIRECIANQHGKRVEEIDISVTFPNRTEIDLEWGLFIIPQDANITCLNCNESTGDCDECICDTCVLLYYIDDDLSGSAIFGIVFATLIVVAGIGVAGICVFLFIKKQHAKMRRVVSESQSQPTIMIES